MERRPTRICSCCGQSYKEWKKQDNEGNMCQKCTTWGLRREVKELHKSEKLIADSLNEENRAKFLTFPSFKRKLIVAQAWKDGILTY